MATTDSIAYGTYTAMTVTSLNGVTNSATVGWQSDRITNLSLLAVDYEVVVAIPAFPATAPGSDKALYVYVCPWVWDGSAWIVAGDLGTITLPTGSAAAGTIAAPPNLLGPKVINYTTQAQPLRGWFNIASLCGGIVPDGWSLVVINFTGATIPASPVIGYKAINYTNA